MDLFNTEADVSDNRRLGFRKSKRFSIPRRNTDYTRVTGISND